MGADDDVAVDVSAYETKRLQRIQQNQQMLQSLGIALQPRERKRRLTTKDENAAPCVEPRRSSRLQQQQQQLEQPPASAAESLLDRDASPRRLPRARMPEYKPVKLPRVEEPGTASRLSGKRSRQSCMMLDLDFTAFHDRWLGKQIWPKGKATVMEGMCPQHVPTFSRMLGIQQWRNGVALFVNVQGASGYENSFAEVPAVDEGVDEGAEPSAVHFRWFAQERQTESSPAIVRLMAAQAGERALWLEGAAPPSANEETTGAKAPEPVLLFLRHVDGPYIYCGRLGYLGHLADAKPVEFRWQLLDLDKIQWSEVKQLLGAGDQPVDGAVVEAQPPTGSLL